MKSRSEKVRKIAVISLMLALTVIFCFVPISFGTVTLALMILPTLIIAQTEDFLSTLIMGILMGIVNYIAWFTTKAATLLAPIFQNPLVCILPRILLGLAAYGLRRGLGILLLKAKTTVDQEGKTIITNKKSLIFRENLIGFISTAVGVLANTLLVGAFTLIFYNGTALGNTIITVQYILAWFGINFVIEIVSFSLIVPPITFALRKAKLVPQEKYYYLTGDNNPEKS